MNTDELLELIETTPNDTELGGKIRRLYNQHQLNNLKKNMFKTSSKGVFNSLKNYE